MKQILKLGAVLAATGIAAGVAPAAMAQAQPATAAAAAVREFEGTVASVGQRNTFRMRTEGGRRVRLVVNRATRFERIAGFAGLASGQVIEVDAQRRDGRWIALEVERRRDGDRRGGDDDGHSGDDDRGGDDDDRSGRGGADDGPDHD